MRTSLWLTLGGGLALASCATLEHGTVTKSLPDDQARIELGSDDGLAQGSRVELFQKDCEYSPPAGAAMDMDTQTCQDLPIGGAQVVEVEGPHKSIIVVDQGVHYAFGTIVKPARMTHEEGEGEEMPAH